MAKKFYITTSIPYASEKPHIGNALDQVYADVIARYRRLKGDEVYFLAGSDEHGTKNFRAAKAAGKSVREFVNSNTQKIKAQKEILNLSWDDFIRTSDRKRHFPAAQKLWREINKKGDIYKKYYHGLYCIGCEAFITEKDLKDGKCSIHFTVPQAVKEENYFFRLSRYTKKIRDLISKDQYLITPASRKKEILSLLNKGLEDISISRPKKVLAWGIPVPSDPDHVIYVWFEALIVYLSAVGYGGKAKKDLNKFKKWWPTDVQVVGKDNLRFHAAIWPAMLLSAGIPVLKQLFVHGFWNINGQRISKTTGNVIYPEEVTKEYGIDALRYYLLRDSSPYEDGNFSHKKFEERYHGELVSGLGNFASRVTTLAAGLGVIEKEPVESKVATVVRITKKEASHELNDFRFHEALAKIWNLIKFGDSYITRLQPWKTKDPKIIFNLVVILDNLAWLIQPMMPETAQKITKSIKWISSDTLRVKKIEPLFPRL